MSNVLTTENKTILLGNEAIVRGALESGVQFVSTYPGTPASEIGNTFYKIAKEAGVYPAKSRKAGISPKAKLFNRVYFEFSTNEKVALEAGIGASFSNLKTLVAMKNFGLNVCSDALLPFVYTGTVGPTVIVVADDPSCHSSAQSEENSRAFSYLAHIPTLEPADPQECKDFVKLGFEISEKFKIPVMIRITTRVAHQKMPVKLGKIIKRGSVGRFIKNKKQFVTMPPRVLEMKKEVLEKIEEIRGWAEKSKINEINNKKLETPHQNKFGAGQVRNLKLGIITSGVSYLYVMEALKELKLNLPILKLGFFYPLPEKKIKSFIKNLKKVLIVEELEPWLEKEIKILARENNPKLQVFGKDILSEIGETKPDDVIFAVSKLIGRKPPTTFGTKVVGGKRFPQLCPGCPYWLIFGAIKKATDQKQVIFGGDIGCYMLAGLPPHHLQDYLSCMGSSIGIAHGIKKALQQSSGQATNQKLITLIGDSTFFHAGIPPLINTVFNKSNPLIIIMNNEITAMTGQQPHPGVDGLKIEDIVKACGVKNLKIIDPVNQKEFIETIKNFLNKKEVSVIIARHPCIFVKK